MEILTIIVAIMGAIIATLLIGWLKERKANKTKKVKFEEDDQEELPKTSTTEGHPLNLYLFLFWNRATHPNSVMVNYDKYHEKSYQQARNEFNKDYTDVILLGIFNINNNLVVTDALPDDVEIPIVSKAAMNIILEHAPVFHKTTQTPVDGTIEKLMESAKGSNPSLEEKAALNFLTNLK